MVLAITFVNPHKAAIIMGMVIIVMQGMAVNFIIIMGRTTTMGKTMATGRVITILKTIEKMVIYINVHHLLINHHLLHQIYYFSENYNYHV